MDTVLICGGPIEEDYALQVLREKTPDYIIGIDRGLNFCYRYEVHPDYILGDFDSIDKKILEYYEQKSEIPVKRYKPEKDDTDTKIGLELAIKLGSDRIFLLGATGGRLDHYMGNLQALTAVRKEGIEAWILDKCNAITVLDRATIVRKADQFGKYISFFSISDQVEGLTLKGFKYPLEDYVLTNVDGLCVSNEIEQDEARIEFSKGLLLMIMSRDE